MVRQTGLRGRWEVLGTEPLTIADTAHNPPGWKLAMEQLTHVANGQPIHMVFGVVQGKDVESMIQAMPSNLKLYLTCPEVARGMPVQELFSKFTSNQSVIGRFDTAWDAYQNALNHAASTDVIYLGGSTFIVADIMKKMFS
jgi:dihydrofolate synthase/folylpolyglutamate synthase